MTQTVLTSLMEPSTRDALLAGGFGGACLCVVGAPFDLVKVRQQQAPGASAAAVIRTVLCVEGTRGLWRGVTPPLLVAVPQFAVVFGTYDAARRLLRRFAPSPNEIRDAGAAGALVAVPTSFIYTPVDRVKLALQADGRRVASGGVVARYASALHCALPLCGTRKDRQRLRAASGRRWHAISQRGQHTLRCTLRPNER